MATLYWDLTRACNAHCVYCSAAQARAQAAGPPILLGGALRILDRLSGAGVTGIVLLGGEPTLHPHLASIACAARARGLEVGIATNAQALGARLRRDLLEAGELSINVSLDSVSAEENDGVRGTGYLARALAGLKALLAERRALDSPLHVTIQATLTRVTLPRLEEGLLRLHDLGVDGVLLERMRPYAWQAPEVRALAPDPGEWILGAVRAARAAVRIGEPGRIRLNYGLMDLRARLREAYGVDFAPERRCPGGYEVALLDLEGCLHPCRHVLDVPSPRRATGEPWFTVERLTAAGREGENFLQSAYFTRFFNFAHSAETFAGLALCSACAHGSACEPCPLDVATHGPGALAECRWLRRHGLPEGR